MTIDQEVDIFLEHFGKKGMKWGVRKAKSSSTSSTPKDHSKRNRNLKIAGGVAAVAAVVAGGLYAKKVLGNSGTRTVRELPTFSSAAARKQHAHQILKRNGNGGVSAASLAKRHAKQLKGFDQQLMIGDQAKRGISNFPTVGAQPWQRD